MLTNVVVMEDNPSLAERLTKALNDGGCLCRAAGGVERTLRLVDAFCPHVVVADFHVTDGTAADLLEGLRKRRLERLPVLLATAAPTVARQVAERYPQVKTVLEKPVPVDRLVGMVREVADTAFAPPRRCRLISLEERMRLLQAVPEETSEEHGLLALEIAP